MTNMYLAKINGKDFITRIRLAAACCDSDPIPKVDDAGGLQMVGETPCQIMHNGTLVKRDCYYGDWMTQLIRLLRGHHEPQEEWAFHNVLSQIKPGSVMIEGGCYWSYYSLWFRRAIPESRTILVEPGRKELETGLLNFRLNGLETEFENAFVGASDLPGSGGGPSTVSVDGLMQKYRLERVNLLHMDIQGAELDMLAGAEDSLRNHRIDFVFVSTHNDARLHAPCLGKLRDFGYKILCEHNCRDSFAFDGVIVAVSPNASSLDSIVISKRSALAGIWSH